MLVTNKDIMLSGCCDAVIEFAIRRGRQVFGSANVPSSATRASSPRLLTIYPHSNTPKEEYPTQCDQDVDGASLPASVDLQRQLFLVAKQLVGAPGRGGAGLRQFSIPSMGHKFDDDDLDEGNPP